MVRIDFLIVGAAKSGTTSLHRYLAQHPEIFLPEAKELAYFLGLSEDRRELDLLERFYATVERGQKVGLSEANMLLFPHVPTRIRAHNPDARILAVLRNPIERAYSGYWFSRLRGWDPCPSFEQALARETRGEMTSRYDRINFTYLEHGHYADQLSTFLEVFESERVLVILTEDLAERPSETLKGVLRGLGVAARTDGIALHRRHNVTSHARFPKMEILLSAAASPARALLRHLLPHSNRAWIRARLVRPLQSLSRTRLIPPPMRPEVRERLQEYYKDHNARLERLLGRDLSHWH